MRQGSLLLLLAAAACGACATLADEAGDRDLVRPNAGAGPFRDLRGEEVETTAPNLIDSPYKVREPSVIPLDLGPDAGRVAAYAVADIGGVTGIYRFLAPADARSFDRAPSPATPVLVPRDSWEGGFVGQPELQSVGAELWMFYAAEGGIGLARSSDGVVFDRLPAPVLEAQPGLAWTAGEAPSSPGFLGAGERLFFSANGYIGEASGFDGARFDSVVAEPVLGPAGGPLGGDDEAFDSSGVFDAFVESAVSAEGRAITRLYYSGANSRGERMIGLAARFGESGAMSRATAPAFTGRDPASPCVRKFDGFSLLYVAQRAGITSGKNYPALAAGVAPATVRIPLSP